MNTFLVISFKKDSPLTTSIRQDFVVCERADEIQPFNGWNILSIRKLSALEVEKILKEHGFIH